MAGGEWQRAVLLLSQMQLARVSPGIVSAVAAEGTGTVGRSDNTGAAYAVCVRVYPDNGMAMAQCPLPAIKAYSRAVDSAKSTLRLLGKENINSSCGWSRRCHANERPFTGAVVARLIRKQEDVSLLCSANSK